MRAVIQRVTTASVTVDDTRVAEIGHGYLVLLGIAKGDTDEDLHYITRKIATMRLFADDDDKINLDINQVGGELLLVSQFTLLAATRKGNRPSFIAAEAPERSIQLYDEAYTVLQQLLQGRVQRGIFGADMKVQLLNDGPVTIILDSQEK